MQVGGPEDFPVDDEIFNDFISDYFHGKKVEQWKQFRSFVKHCLMD